MKDFAHKNLLQKEILFYMAKISRESELDKLKQAFAVIDKDNSGEIEYCELVPIIEKLGLNTTKVILTIIVILIIGRNRWNMEKFGFSSRWENKLFWISRCNYFISCIIKIINV